MSRTTLYLPPDGWDDQIKKLKENGLNRELAQTLLRVELCICLVKKLDIDTYETVGVIPALLSGISLYSITWDKQQKRAIANVRQISPYGSSTAWRNALETYAQISEEYRHYAFPDLSLPEISDDVEDEESEQEEMEDTQAPKTTRTEWFVCNLKEAKGAENYPQHSDLYKAALEDCLPCRTRSQEFAKAETPYRFTSTDRDGVKTTYPVTLPRQLPMAKPKNWFAGRKPRKREPIIVHLKNDLLPVAIFLDEADKKAGRKSKRWQERLGKIRYRRVNPDGTIDETCPDEIILDGFHHAAGMVASGKSTLAFLLAAWIILAKLDLRISIVVGDVQSSLRFADELNTYFFSDVENNKPVAVPLLGRRSRDKHLRDLYGSRDYHEKRRQGVGHWGERFLSVVCPLQSLISDLVEKPLPAGQEPCGNLRELPKKRKKGGGSEDIETPSEKYFLCPLYSSCPVQQVYRDMENAKIWITNPWAMTYGSVPRQVEPRPVHVGEIIYEQSDIVIFDEADAVMGVFDEVFAEVAELANGKDGIYDRLGTQTERFSISRRSDAGSHRRRWSQAQRDGQDASQILLELLRDKQTAYLRRWMQQTQFTPGGLMMRLTRIICGLVEVPHKDEEDSPEDSKRFNKNYRPFRELFEAGRDPLRQKHLPIDESSFSYRLWRMLLDISDGANIFGDDLLRTCKKWLKDLEPDIQKHLDLINARKKARLGDSPEADFENLERIAYRLIFALAAALLDRNTAIVLYEWYSRAAPDEDDVEPHRNMPAILRDILPLPPIGRQYGTYFAPGDDLKRNTNRLSYLSYTNIGRWYLLNFHRLRADLEDELGPHVLALSGTSYLPDSVRLHVGTKESKPQGLLLPEDEAMDAIRESTFRYLPLSSTTSKTIRISGTPEWEKRAVLISLAQALGSAGGGKFAQELETLRLLGIENPAHWADRRRLLLFVNSYEQAKIVGDALRQSWRENRENIYHLARTPKSREGDELIGGNQYKPNDDEESSLLRTDIETFAQTCGNILIAPMSAVGRGFNILNQSDPPIAAFGAVYFLVRPYPHPDDMTALARELNRRTLDWAEWGDFSPWKQDSIEGKFRAMRRHANEYWHDMERRKYWSTLHERPVWMSEPRKDLAAFTAGIIIQAVGRLLRGGVPFHGFFCDAAFAPNTAKWYCEGGDGDRPTIPDAPFNSLLAAVIDSLREQVGTDPVARMLYEPLSDALCCSYVGLEPNDYPFEPLTHWQLKKP